MSTQGTTHEPTTKEPLLKPQSDPVASTSGNGADPGNSQPETFGTPIDRDAAEGYLQRFNGLKKQSVIGVKYNPLTKETSPDAAGVHNLLDADFNAFVFGKHEVDRFFNGKNEKGVSADYLMVMLGAKENGAPTVVLVGVNKEPAPQVAAKEVTSGAAAKEATPGAAANDASSGEVVFTSLDIAFPGTEQPPKFYITDVPAAAPDSTGPAATKQKTRWTFCKPKTSNE
jgi:hypothetical protein